MEEREALARRIYEKWSSDGPAATVKSYFSDDFEYHDMPEVPDKAVVHGRDAMVDLWREREELIGHFDIQLEEISDMGDELLTVVRLRSRTDRGFDVDMRHVHLLLFRDGRLTRLRAFTDRDEAESASTSAR
jgi:ketosteroid isomerase-like protein